MSGLEFIGQDVGNDVDLGCEFERCGALLGGVSQLYQEGCPTFLGLGHLANVNSIAAIGQIGAGPAFADRLDTKIASI